MPTVKIEVERFRTDRQKELLKMLNDKKVQREANKILKDYINWFVPKQSGKLRKSAIVTYQSISWGKGLKYAHYQYEGEIYGPNYPIVKGGRIVGWYSKSGKHPTGRMMKPYSMGNEWMGWPFGYNEPGTEHHWDVKFNSDAQWKAKANKEVTDYLKRECRQRKLNK